MTGIETTIQPAPKAMIFAAGLGTRFKPWTDHHPKALAVVNGKSLLQRNIEYLQSQGITDVVVNVHHFADQIVEAVQQNHGWGSRITISDETDAVLETGGGLAKARPLLEGNAPFVTINADILTDFDINSLLDYHQTEGALISFAISERNTSRYFLFDENNRLSGWTNTQTGEEKIVRPSPLLRRMAYSCVVVFDPALFPLIKQTGKFSLTDMYLDLAPDHNIMGYPHNGCRWIDVGKTESVKKAEALFI
jgi:N-acetyl-alpha-D-muramate 1-phosphate uridylyltransferase